MNRECPDCDVALEAVDHQAGADVPSESISIAAPDAGLTSVRPGVGKRYLDAFLCTECGLIRFYARVD